MISQLRIHKITCWFSTVSVLFTGGLIFLAGFFVVLPATAETRQANILNNPGFEESGFSSEILNWRPWAMYNEPIDPAKASITADKETCRSGKRSLRIEAKDDKEYGCEQSLDADALCKKSSLSTLDGATLKLAGFIKGDAKDAHLTVDFDGNKASYQTSKPGDTTNGWTRHTLEWVLPNGTRPSRVHCILNGSGTSWFDDLCLTITAPGKESAGTDKNLLENAGFEESVEKEFPAGWKMENGTAKIGLDSHVRHGGKAGLRVGGAGFCNVIHEADGKDLPKGEELVLTGFVKMNGDPSKNFASLWLQFRMPGNKTSRVDCDGLSGTMDWKEIKTHMVVPKDCEQATVGVYYFSQDDAATAWFDDFVLRKSQPGEKLERTFARKTMEGPGLAYAEGAYEFPEKASAQGAKIAFPIPQMYEEQAPFYIEFITRPEGAIQKVTIKKRTEAFPNWFAEVEFKPLKVKKIEFDWKGYVLFGIHDYDSLPKGVKIASEKDLPPEVRPWLKATKSVQSGDPAIKKKAQELRAPDADCIQTICNVLKCSTEIVQQEGKPHDTTAADTLKNKGGECTSAANLAAALLRAAGIPARVLANYPNWNTPFQTHYFVEAYVPGFGWARGESIMNRFPVQSYENVIVSVVYPKDEDESFRTENLVEGSGAIGCPWLSMTEPLNTNSSFRLPWNDCDHVGVPLVEFKAAKTEMDPVLELTRKVWSAYLERAASGTPVKQALELQKKACSAGSLEEFKDLMQKAYETYAK